MTFQEALVTLKVRQYEDELGGCLVAIAEQVEANRVAQIATQVAHQKTILALMEKFDRHLREVHTKDVQHFEAQLSKKLAANHPNRSLREDRPGGMGDW